jgi:hypothetical protein
VLVAQLSSIFALLCSLLAGLHSAPFAPIENLTTQTSREEAKPAAGPGTAITFWIICPRSGYLLISAIRLSTRRPSGSRCEALSSSVGNRRKSVNGGALTHAANAAAGLQLERRHRRGVPPAQFLKAIEEAH